MKYTAKIAAIALIGAFSQGANAFQYFTTTQCPGGLNFNSGYMTFNYGTSLFESEKTAIDIALGRTTAFSDSNIAISNRNDGSFSTGNGQNEIYWDGTVGTAQCWASFNTSTCNVAEADMRFGTPTWYTGEDSQHIPFLSGGPRPIIGTAVHEAGHCIGMGHENVMYNMMGQDWNHVNRNALTTYYGPGEDLSNGLIVLHGEKSGGSDTYRDVGATVFRYSGASGAYSAHALGVLRNTSGTTLPSVGTFSGQPIYRVTPGQTVQMEVTLENNGEMGTETPNIGWYLSTNSTISTGDTSLGTGSATLGRNTPFEWTPNVTIPSNTAIGDYFLGIYLDHDFQIPETTSLNNIAYYPVRVSAPDLITQSPGVNDTTLLVGQSFVANATVRNQGNQTSGSSTLRYYRSTNSTISGIDTQIGTDFVSGLVPNGTSFESATVSAPATAGTYWIGACVDTVSGEVTTNNQCSAGVQVTVSAPPPTVTTNAVTNILSVKATFNATVNPNGLATTVYFDYTTDGVNVETVNAGSIGSGTSPVNVSLEVDDLICNTGYVVAARAVSVGGEVEGNIQLFGTLMCPTC